jgi:predicted ATPase/class 3 adenylate cyclase
VLIRVANAPASENLDGERKTVTALFADIKGLTELEQDLDPEDARAIVDPALKLMIRAVHRYEGYVAQSTGDGIFALFGAPVAHEDHPQRALYAALRMQEDLKRYAGKLREQGQPPLSVRVGVNSGEVVVRSIQTGDAHTEYTPIGHSINLASRLQTLAAPGSVVIGKSVQKFVEGFFQLKALGTSRIKGVSEVVEVFEVTGLGPLRTQLQRAAGRGLTKFVGREPEMEALKRAAEQAKGGHGQIVAAMAEPGVGKSRLFYEFKATSQTGWMVLEAFSVSHGKASAYLPVIELLRSYFRIASEDDERTRREKVAGKIAILDRSLEDTLPYLFGLLGIVQGDYPLEQTEGQVRRRRIHEAIKRILLRESLNQPLIVIFEDLHWIDEQTQALLNLLADSVATARVLLLVNYRPEYSQQWGSKTYYTQLRLDPLGKESAEEMLSALLGDGKDLIALKRLIIERTEGTPFFMEEIVQALFEDGVLQRNGAVKLARSMKAVKVPPTVQAVLASRIDRLPAEEKELLQTLAVLGRDFPVGLVQRVTRKPEDELERMLSGLQAGEFIYEQPAARDIEYTFKHSLTHDVAYDSLLIERRKLLHERAGLGLESMYGDQLDDHLGELAHHYSRSDNVAKAVEYLGQAGQQAAQRSAYADAISNLSAAIDLLQRLPDGPERIQREVLLQLALGPALIAVKGWAAPEVERAYTRARELCERVGDPPQHFPALFGLWYLHLTRGELRTAYEFAEQLLWQAQSAHDPALLLQARDALGITSYWMGEFLTAREHLENAIALYDPERHQPLMFRYGGADAGVRSLAYAAITLWPLGYPDQGLKRSNEALTLAQALSGECAAALAQAPAAPAKKSNDALIRVADAPAAENLDGERKTVTALFADIKGSTELMEDLDPEEARAIIDPALKLMIGAVHRYGGYIVQSTGDGIFALFGAPAAHEDHPQRALYAALRMQEDLRRYSDRLRAEGGLPIQARAGVNTGEVVVRSITTGEEHTEYTPIGHTANLAARMQTLAPVGSVAVTDPTRKLCEGYFSFKSLGLANIKGISEPVHVFETTGIGPLRTRLQAAARRGLTKFVGREAELQQMKHALELIKQGHGQVVAAMGEPGVGKSRLFFEFKAKNQSGWMVLETFSVSHGKASVYLPVIDLLQGYFGIDAEDDGRKRREKVAGKVAILDRSLEDALPYLFGLMGIVEGEDALAQMDGQIKRRRTLDAIKRILLRESMNQPLMLIFEDLNWIDEQTQALLNLLADSIGTAKILLLVNYRPEYSHPWGSKTYYTQLRLDPLGKESADEMISALLGDDLQLSQIKRVIIDKTEGNPFFMEETVQMLLDEGALVRDGGAVKLTRPISELKIPPTVQGILTARIDRLAPDTKELLQTLSVIGREFPMSLIRAVVPKSDDELNRMLGDLQLAEFIYEQFAIGDTQYIFKHALTQEVSYNSVLLEHRRQLHERIGGAGETAFANLEDHLAELAHHYLRSANRAKALEFLHRAGEQAIRRASYSEGESYFAAALEVVLAMPDSVERDARELRLRSSFVQALWVTKGWGAPEVLERLSRARALAEKTGNLPELVLQLWAGAMYANSRGDYLSAAALADQTLETAQREGSPISVGLAHQISLTTRFYLGDLVGTEGHFARGRAFCEAPGFLQIGALAVVGTFGQGSWNAWTIGHADAARERDERMRRVLEGAQRNPWVTTCAQITAANLHAMLREFARAEAFAGEALASCEEFF